MSRRRRTPIILWPFLIIWRLACAIVRLVGRIASLILGILLIFVGLLMSATIIGAVVGIPLILVGAVLVICALARRGRFLADRRRL